MMTRSPLMFLCAPLLIAGCDTQTSTVEGRADIATVTRGNLVIMATESASLRSAEETKVKSGMEGKATVIWLIPEGSQVKKGDKLVELDASQQIEKQAQQEISVRKAGAQATNAEKELEILKKQNKTDIQGAENNLLFAEMDLEKFRGKIIDKKTGEREMGERAQSIQAEMEQIKLAEAELKLAEDKYENSKHLRKLDFITQNELERNELDLQSKRTKLTLAKNRLEILRDYTHIKTEKELEQRVADAIVEKERVIAKCEAKLIQASADLESKQAEYALADERLDNLETQIENSIVYAPSPGIVVYAYEGDWRRRQYIELGASVRERQNLVVLPDTSRMIAEARIHEAMADKVKAGQSALIEVDNLSKALPGRVIRRAPLPDSTSRWGNPDLKVYKTEVEILTKNEDMAIRPGMSGTVKILIDELEDVLQLPIQAVNRQGAVNFVWLVTPSGPVATKVELGESNSTHMVAKSGVEEGQQVYLAKPAGVTDPEFEQPAQEMIKPDPTLAKANPSEGASNGNGGSAQANNANAQRGRRRRGGRSSMLESTEGKAFMALLKQKSPALHTKLAAGDMSAYRDSEFRALRESDPEVKSAWDKVSAARRAARARGRGGNSGTNSPARVKLMALVKAKNPELHQRLVIGGFSAWRDPEFKRLQEEDPEVKAAWDEMMASFRRGRGGNRGGDDGGEGRRGRRGRGGRGRGGRDD